MNRSFARFTFCILLFSTPVISQADPLIGYGSSNYIRGGAQELYVTGFKMGLESTLKRPINKDLLLVNHNRDTEFLGALRSAQYLIDRGVKVLVGFPTSHEALLVANLAKEKGVLFISAGSAADQLASFGPNVYSMSGSIDNLTNEMLKVVDLKLHSKNVGIIFSKRNIISVNILEEVESKSKDFKLFHYSLDNENLLSEEQLKNIRQDKIDTLIVTTVTKDSPGFLEQLNSNRIDLPLVTYSSFTVEDTDLVKHLLSIKNTDTYSFSIWNNSALKSQTFRRLYFAKFGKKIIEQVAAGFDLGIVVGNLVNRRALPGQTKDSKSFELPCFDGISAANICFNQDGGHAKIKYQRVKFKKRIGFVPDRDPS